MKLLELLRAEGAEVTYHDPHVATLPDDRLSPVGLDGATLTATDRVVIATTHAATDLWH